MNFKIITSYLLLIGSGLSPLNAMHPDHSILMQIDEPAVGQADKVTPVQIGEPALGQPEEVTPIQRAESANSPVLYYADSQTYDRELGILILKGHVEFEHESNILEADYVTYNENTDVITASGNVRLRQVDGDIEFADYLELTGDMKDGILLQLRALLKDDSKIAALEGRKFEGRQELDRAVYTPCKLCGDLPPTWQLNALHAVKDDVNKDITFTDAEFRFFDIPLLYLPYSTQPLERRSGFLIPHINFTSDFGALFKVPYFIALSEDKDITLTPVFFTKNNPLLLGEYRQSFGSGVLNVEGSIANYKKSEKDKKDEIAVKKARARGIYRDFNIPETRGHIFAELKTNITDIWRLKLEGGYVSDKTYFRKYKFSGWQQDNALTSLGVLEGFLNQRDYAAIKAYHFQGLRVNRDHQRHIASPLPIMEYSAYSGVDPLGGRFKFDGNFLNLVRQKGLNMQRGIGQIGWQRPWNTSSGQVFTLFASTRGDLYKVEHSHNREIHNLNLSRMRRQDRLSSDPFIVRKGGARFFPQTGFDWRWPFIKPFCQQSVIVQPVGQLIAAPVQALGDKARDFPNEDSADPSFNDANLFSPDRFPGYDRIDTGSRAVYGGEVLTTGSLFGDVEVFLGQSYSLSTPQRKRMIQGLHRHASDYVGRVQATPFSWLSLNYRFRLDQKSFNTRVTEVGGAVGPSIAKLSTTYVFISKHAGTRDNRDFNQINLVFSSQFTKNWTLYAKIIRNLEPKQEEDVFNKHNGYLEKGVGLMYIDDCFGLGLTAKRQYYRAVDLRPATVYLVTLYLKNIGTFGTSVNPSGVFGNRDSSQNLP